MWSAFWTIDDTGMKLAEVDDRPGWMTVLVAPLERECMRFDEAGIQHCQITHQNNHVRIIWGKTTEFINSMFKRLESRSPRQP